MLQKFLDRLASLTGEKITKAQFGEMVNEAIGSKAEEADLEIKKAKEELVVTKSELEEVLKEKENYKNMYSDALAETELAQEKVIELEVEIKASNEKVVEVKKELEKVKSELEEVKANKK